MTTIGLTLDEADFRMLLGRQAVRKIAPGPKDRVLVEIRLADMGWKETIDAVLRSTVTHRPASLG